MALTNKKKRFGELNLLFDGIKVEKVENKNIYVSS